MGWRFSLDGVELAEDDLTAGQLADLYVIVNAAVVHSEMQIGVGPFAHCPVCRVAIGALAMTVAAPGLGLGDAADLVREVPAGELAEAFVRLPEALSDDG